MSRTKQHRSRVQQSETVAHRPFRTAKNVKLHLLIGRAMVVHGGADDLKSQPSGNLLQKASFDRAAYLFAENTEAFTHRLESYWKL